MATSITRMKMAKPATDSGFIWKEKYPLRRVFFCPRFVVFPAAPRQFGFGGQG